MPIPQVDYSPEARADLLAIETYTAIKYGETQAQLIVGRLKGTILNFSYMPGMGRPRPHIRAGALMFPVSPWIIVYEPLPSLDGIAVLRVIDSRRDLPRHLR